MKLSNKISETFPKAKIIAQGARGRRKNEVCLRLDHNQLDYILHPFTLFNKWAIFFRNSFNDEFVSVFETFKRFMKQQILINCKEGGLPHSAALQMKHFQPQLFAWFS
ncbi:hypothetical protein AM232_02510 [Bacillus sp. FJAT-21352]|nr:hypothetical protein AM232_02510 [Bacillus sp. FJAT-21352]